MFSCILLWANTFGRTASYISPSSKTPCNTSTSTPPPAPSHTSQSHISHPRRLSVQTTAGSITQFNTTPTRSFTKFTQPHISHLRRLCLYRGEQHRARLAATRVQYSPSSILQHSKTPPPPVPSHNHISISHVIYQSHQPSSSSVSTGESGTAPGCDLAFLYTILLGPILHGIYCDEGGAGGNNMTWAGLRAGQRLCWSGAGACSCGAPASARLLPAQVWRADARRRSTGGRMKAKLRTRQKTAGGHSPRTPRGEHTTRGETAHGETHPPTQYVVRNSEGNT